MEMCEYINAICALKKKNYINLKVLFEGFKTELLL